jgi:hypothetical protein
MIDAYDQSFTSRLPSHGPPHLRALASKTISSFSRFGAFFFRAMICEMQWRGTRASSIGGEGRAGEGVLNFVGGLAISHGPAS